MSNVTEKALEKWAQELPQRVAAMEPLMALEDLPPTPPTQDTPLGPHAVSVKLHGMTDKVQQLLSQGYTVTAPGEFPEGWYSIRVRAQVVGHPYLVWASALVPEGRPCLIPGREFTLSAGKTTLLYGAVEKNQ